MPLPVGPLTVSYRMKNVTGRMAASVEGFTFSRNEFRKVPRLRLVLSFTAAEIRTWVNLCPSSGCSETPLGVPALPAAG